MEGQQGYGPISLALFVRRMREPHAIHSRRMLPLDTPIWTALTTKQALHAQTSALARRFPPEMTLLGALAANTAMAFDSLAQLIQRDAVNLYFTSPPQIPAGWDVVRSVELHQMVQETDAPSLSSGIRATKPRPKSSNLLPPMFLR